MKFLPWDVKSTNTSCQGGICFPKEKKPYGYPKAVIKLWWILIPFRGCFLHYFLFFFTANATTISFFKGLSGKGKNKNLCIIYWNCNDSNKKKKKTLKASVYTRWVENSFVCFFIWHPSILFCKTSIKLVELGSRNKKVALLCKFFRLNEVFHIIDVMNK